MLTRIAIDNYKCFTNFELSFDSINLLLGPNGTGKSSIFQVLRKLHSFVALQMQARELFFASESTRWSQQQNQKFGVDFEYRSHHYQYEIEIEFDARGNPSVKMEHLLVDRERLVHFENEKVYLNGQSPYPLEPNRSAISSIPSSSGFEHLSIFRQLLHRILVVQVLPPIMEGTSRDVAPFLWPDSHNLISWYRFITQNPGFNSALKEYLADIFPGFEQFQFVDIGQDAAGKNNKGLLLQFSNSEDGIKTPYSFAELSDGERAVIALYSLIVYAKLEGYILCLDEPENFLALAEIQPWLIELYDLSSDRSFQVILISHHPEVLNYLAVEAGIWFDRAETGSVLTQPVIDEADTGLSVSDLVARGWIGA